MLRRRDDVVAMPVHDVDDDLAQVGLAVGDAGPALVVRGGVDDAQVGPEAPVVGRGAHLERDRPVGVGGEVVEVPAGTGYEVVVVPEPGDEGDVRVGRVFDRVLRVAGAGGARGDHARRRTARSRRELRRGERVLRVRVGPVVRHVLADRRDDREHLAGVNAHEQPGAAHAGIAGLAVGRPAVAVALLARVADHAQERAPRTAAVPLTTM